jgi:hypothetical protein
MGFTKAFNLAQLEQLTQPISKTSGIAWLLTTLILFTSFLLFILGKDFWWILGFCGIVLSQVLIFQSWSDAKAGTLANLIILVPVIISFINSRPNSFHKTFQITVQEQLSIPYEEELLNISDIQHLPDIVQKYLHFVGAIGQPKVYNFKGNFSGRMKMKQDGPWMNIQSTQYNFYGNRSRIFYIKSKMFGIPFDGLHFYSGNEATMRIKIASLFQVADAKGALMTQGETVTLFNDMCLLAPSTLISKDIGWQIVEPLHIKALFSNAGYAIKADLFFKETGELIDFHSNDRYESSDGKTYNNYKWSTPVKNYKTLPDGRKIPSYGEAIWHKPDGPFNYANFNMDEIEYNCKK